MCIAIPKKVLATHHTATGASAEVEGEGEKPLRVDTSLLENVQVGDYILVFRGQALRIVSEEEARQIGRALACVAGVMQGGSGPAVEEAFDDLIEHPASLPEHLAAQVGKKVI